MRKAIKKFKRWKQIALVIIGLLVIVMAWQLLKKPAIEADWQTQLAVPSIAEFNGDLVTVRNVRNFRYSPTEADVHPDYYDRTYNLNEIKKVWYVTEPFNGQEYAAHTFLSFEFNNGDFLAITIEARKTKDQKYNIFKGIFRTYPLMYIAADERDILLLRTNLRKDNVYVYPVKLSKPENSRLLLVDMLERMNEIVEKPVWYNTFTANCTSSIAYHVNRISSGRVPALSWGLWLTGYADELALEKGLIDTDLPIEEARKKYLVTPRSQEIGDVENYSKLIRQSFLD
jgi:hypothetical protein